ncbi:MAG: hydrogenase formation protein HypD [Actinomycetes bacterium]|jgi:hydrogenase expression/formation protein HypD|nr:hydrogenase formation protein HypD [Actinomycetes bacterium]
MPDFNSSGWRDPDIARRLVAGIHARAAQLSECVHIMEVCGTHTMSIAKNGLRGLLPENVRLLSGPGCPVCVTANADIDHAIALAGIDGVTVATFGDMLKVPGSSTSLAAEKAAGADVRVVYSPLDALELAEREPERQIVFIGVGFETTAPTVAATIKRAAAAQLDNFSVFSAHKTVPQALRAIASDPDIALSALILPGHVSTIIGVAPYEFLADEFDIPGVITGFEPVDILQGIYLLIQQLAESARGTGQVSIDIAYGRGVRGEGNPHAVALIEEVFAADDAEWRGLGVIPGTGLTLREPFAAFDARRRFSPEVEPARTVKGCECGDILRGIKRPDECRLFGRACVPERPVGPCMVSSEGSCAAWYRYGDGSGYAA